MSNIGQHFMDLEDTFDPVNPTTKRVAIAVTTEYYYEVGFDFDIEDDDALTSLMANGEHTDQAISGDSQVVRDLATTDSRTFTFTG